MANGWEIVSVLVDMDSEVDPTPANWLSLGGRNDGAREAQALRDGVIQRNDSQSLLLPQLPPQPLPHRTISPILQPDLEPQLFHLQLLSTCITFRIYCRKARTLFLSTSCAVSW